MKKHFAQANREAVVTLVLYAAFFLWWVVFAFGMGSGNPDNYDYVFGLPAWFFWSCVAGYPIFTLILWFALKLVFKDIPLDPPDDNKSMESDHD